MQSSFPEAVKQTRPRSVSALSEPLTTYALGVRNMASQKICSIEGCGKEHLARTFCRMHYWRWHRKGSTAPPQVQKGAVRKWLNDHTNHDCNECLIWPFCRLRNGYGYTHNEGKSILAHRLMCCLVNGPAPSDQPHALHSCGRGHLGCVNPKHLRWGSDKENKADARKHGTMTRGETTGTSKLTEDQVRQVRSRW
jgi:hypothetical protein